MSHDRAVLLLGEDSVSVQRMTAIIENELAARVDTLRNPLLALKSCQQRRYSAAVGIFKTFDLETSNRVRLLQIAEAQPVVILASAISEDVRSQMLKVPSVRLLTMPLPEKAMVKYIRSVLEGVLPGQQMEQRFFTKVKVDIEVYGSGHTGVGQLTNISKSGAAISIEQSDKMIAKGDLLLLSVVLDQIGKQHSLSGQVVWSESEKKAGVVFLPSDQVFAKLAQFSF